MNELELVEEEEQLPPSKKAKRQVASGMSNVLSVYMHLYNLTQTQGSFPVMNIRLIRIVDGARRANNAKITEMLRYMLVGYVIRSC